MAHRDLTSVFGVHKSISRSKENHIIQIETNLNPGSNNNVHPSHLREHQILMEFHSVMKSIENGIEHIDKKFHTLQSQFTTHGFIFENEDDLPDEPIQQSIQDIIQLIHKCHQSINQFHSVITKSTLFASTPSYQRVVQNFFRRLVILLQPIELRFNEFRNKYTVVNPTSANDSNHILNIQDDSKSIKGTASDQSPILIVDGDEVELERRSIVRNQRILILAQQIQEIHTMFVRMNEMVIDQGTVVDRIDWNVEHAHDAVENAVEELVRAAEYQTKSICCDLNCCNRKCLVLLIFIVVLLFLILLLKKHAF